MSALPSTGTAPPDKGGVLRIDCTDSQYAEDLPMIERLCADLGMTHQRSTVIDCPGGCGTIRWVDDETCEACEMIATHKEGCFLRLAATCPVPFPCDAHGLDVCHECYACTCAGVPPKNTAE
jgi:hypothetical protein